MKLATRVSLIKPSPTLTIQAKANALKAAGREKGMARIGEALGKLR